MQNMDILELEEAMRRQQYGMCSDYFAAQLFAVAPFHSCTRAKVDLPGAKSMAAPDDVVPGSDGPFEVVLPRQGGGCVGGSCSRSAIDEPVLRYRPLHPPLFSTHFRREWLEPSFAAAIEDGSDAALRGVLREEVPGRVFSFPMVTPDFCERLLDELQAYEASGLPVVRPNSMNNYGVIVNQIGMKALIDDLQRRYVHPLARLLFPREGASFSSHHTFMVQYKFGEDLGLDMHHDDSDVTLNVCLGREFSGATLSFCGAFGDPAHRKHTHTYSHERGRAIVHLGAHRHGADDIASGERYNLIVWSTNGEWREADEYKALNARNMHGADALEGAPDPICLSMTHDPDYGEYKPYPKGRGPKPGAREMHVKRFTPSEAAARAKALKATGTEDFQAKTFDAAAAKYSCAADFALEAGHHCEPELLGALHLNEAQCRLRLEEPSAASALCSRVLERDPQNVKALYRRACARLELQEYLEARRDLASAAKLEPTNREVRAKLAACKEAAEAQRRQERALYSAMMSGKAEETPPEAPSQAPPQAPPQAPASSEAAEVTGCVIMEPKSHSMPRSAKDSAPSARRTNDVAGSFGAALGPAMARIHRDLALEDGGLLGAAHEPEPPAEEISMW